MTKYGWYSSQQLAHTGGECWRYRDVNGNTVVVASITSTPDHGMKWPDVKFVAELKEDGFIDHTPSKTYDPLFFGLYHESTIKIMQDSARRQRAYEKQMEEKSAPRKPNFNYWV